MSCGYGSCGYCSPAPAGGGGYGANNSSAQYSSLESAVAEYSPVMRMSEESGSQQQAVMPHSQDYLGKKNQQYAGGAYLHSRAGSSYYFSPNIFLNDTPTEFISCKDEQQKKEVRMLVEQAFEAATGRKIPGDIAIRICSGEELRKIHESIQKPNNRLWNPGIMGFSLNRKGFGISEIFAKEEELARLMLTIGHEIGHVLTFPMKDAVDEEAKAFAFSMAWMRAIRESNIGGLCDVISPAPAKNGLHNRAFDFVAGLIRKGMKAIDVYLGLINQEISINNIVTVY